MDDLIAFVTARLDEDEAAAQEAASRPLGPAWDDGTRLTAVARHIARHDPARVLREIAAKRVILARWEFAANQVAVGAVNEAAGYGPADPGWPLRADSHELDVRSLAVAWNDHPDYRPEWAL